VQRQCLLGVAFHGFEQCSLVSTAWHPQVDTAAASQAEQLGHGLGVGWEFGYEHLSRDLVPRTGPGFVPHVGFGIIPGLGPAPGRGVQARQVFLGEELFDEIGDRGVVHPVHDPAALAADPAAAYVEHLYRRFKLIVGESDDVGVGAVREDNRLLLHGTAQRADVVTEPGGAFIVLGIGGLAHLAFEPA
jgi:hypothetical protein